MIAIQKIEVREQGLKLFVKDEPLTMFLANRNFGKLKCFDLSSASVTIISENQFFDMYMLVKFLETR